MYRIVLGSSDGHDEASVVSRTPSRCPTDPDHPGWARIFAHENQAGLHPRVLAKMCNLPYVSPPTNPEPLGFFDDPILEQPYFEEDYGTAIEETSLGLPVDDIALPQAPGPDPYPAESDPVGHEPKYVKLKNKLKYHGFGRVRSRAAPRLLFPLVVRDIFCDAV